jgi:MYXO-CTERM domain-containing protein
MIKITLAVGLASLCVAARADAGVRGYSSFHRVAANGNVIVDLVVVTDRASDRLLNVFNVRTTSVFLQGPDASAQGFRPDSSTSTRSNATDSFCTLGVFGGGPIGGEYYAPANQTGGGSLTSPDGGFTTGWSSASSAIPTNAGWFFDPPFQADSLSESLSNFVGQRSDSSTAAATGQWGVWCGHWVFAPGTTSAVIAMNVSVKDGVSGATMQPASQSFDQLPAPGALALLGLAGAAGSRRRRN